MQEFYLNLPDRPPQRRIGRNDVVMPKDEIYVAENILGIDPKVEPHLLWISQDALNTPLPPDWQFEWNGS